MPIQLLIASQAALWGQAQQLAAPWLSSEEFLRYSSLQTERRQREFIACRYGLRQVLRLSGIQLNNVHLSAREGTAPAVIPNASIPEPPGLSLAHSQAYVGCASGPCALGLDLEVLPSKRLRNISDASQLVCSPSELQMLNSTAFSAEQVKLFIKFWVLKEAWFKCLGTGINFQRINKLCCSMSLAIPECCRVIGYAYLWEGKNIEGSELIWAICTEYPLLEREIQVSLGDDLSLFGVQVWRVLEFMKDS